MSIIIEILKSLYSEYKHPRNRLRFFILIILVISIIAYAKFIAFDIVFMFSILLIVVYIFIAYKSTENVILFSKYKLNKLEKIINQGKALENPGLFNKKPWYLIDAKEQLEYYKLKSDFHNQRREQLKAYNCYLNIKKLNLTKTELDENKLNRALLLIKMGAYNKSDLILKEIEERLDQLELKNRAFYYNLKAFVTEKKDMNFTKVVSLLQKSKDLISDLDGEYPLKAQVFNNFGRIRRLQNNITDARYYYKRAKEYTVRTKEASLIAVIFDNLISIYSLNGEYELLEKTKNEYMDLLEESLFTKEEKLNLQLSIARDNLYSNDYKSFIIESYFKFKKDLSRKEKLIFNVNALRLMSNSFINAQVVAEEIANNINKYFKLSMPDKFQILNEVEIFMRNKNNLKRFFDSNKIKIDFQLVKVIKMKEKVEKYMKNDALKDIQDYLDSLEEYQVNKRFVFLQFKLEVITKYSEPYNFNRVYKLFLELINICEINGLKERKIDTELNLVDEMLGLIGKIKDDKFDLKKMIRMHLNNIDQILSRIEIIPYLESYYIRTSYYYLSQDEIEKAEKYYNIIKRLSINPRNYSNWIKKQLKVIQNYFS